MCSVTFMPQPYGFSLGMNRDESRHRAIALPPRVFRYGGRAALHPHEASGGTWIGVNDAGLCCALLNWYAIPTDKTRVFASRGQVIPALLRAADGDQAGAVLRELPLRGVAPFRVVITSASDRSLCEFRWNQDTLVEKSHHWEMQHWFSSGFDEPGAQQTRSRAAHDAAAQPDASSLAWLRRLHRSHAPEPGPYCLCMHRPDAATVSFTEIDVSVLRATMRYHDGPLCEAPRPIAIHHLSMRTPWLRLVPSIRRDAPSGCRLLSPKPPRSITP